MIVKAYLQEKIKLSSDGFSSCSRNFDGTWDEAIKDLRKKGYVIKTRAVSRKGTPYFDCEILEIKAPILMEVSK